MSGITTCPHCRRDSPREAIQRGPHVCPHCRAPVVPFLEGPLGRNAPIDVRHQRDTGPPVLLVLIGLCVLLIFLGFVVMMRAAEGAAGTLFCLVGLFAVLDLLVIVAGSRAVWRWLVGPDSGVGRVLGVIALCVGLAFGTIVFFFTLCFTIALGM